MLSNELPGPWQAATLVQNAEELQALAPYSVDDDVARASDDEFARCSDTSRATSVGTLTEKIDHVQDSVRERPSCYRVVSLDVSSRLGQI